MLELADVTVRFGGRPVLDRYSLSVAEREVVAVLGPSGVGKSTMLRVIAGLQPIDHGSVRWGDEDLTGVPTHRRRIGLVFQDEQLFPHLDIAANVAFGLRMERRSRAEQRRRTAELLDLVGLPGYEGRAVASLSGGEAKRIALARSLAPAPRVLLLDEPLTGLDRELHDRLSTEIRRILTATGTTAVLVTHDPAEAEAIADRSVRMTSVVPPDRDPSA